MPVRGFSEQVAKIGLTILVGSALLAACGGGNECPQRDETLASAVQKDLDELGELYSVTGEPAQALEAHAPLPLAVSTPASGSEIDVSTAQGMVSLPVTARANWSVKNEQEHSRSTPSGSYHLVTDSRDLTATFAFRPVIVDSGDWPIDAGATTHIVHLKLILTADLSKLPVSVAGPNLVCVSIERDIHIETKNIGLPVVVAMFIDPDYGVPPNAGAYLLVRGRSDITLACSKLVEALDPLSRAIDVLRAFTDVASLILGLERVDNAARLDRSKCRLAFSVPNMGIDPLDPGGFLGWGNISAEDSMSSIVMLGAPGAEAQFFNDQGRGIHSARGPFVHNPAGGHFTLTTGQELVVAVANLRPSDYRDGGAVTTPSPVIPRQEAFVINAPPKSFRGVFGDDTFNDELSAAYFPCTCRELVLQP